MKVSVVIPSFDAERFIAQTIRSVLAQTWRAHEIIVVDDGSRDRTGEIVGTFGSDVKFIKIEHGGAAHARNCGASLASGNALMFLDADDVLGPDVLRHLVAGLREVPQGIALCSWRRLERVNGLWIRRPASCAPRVPGDDALQAWLSGWYHPPCSVLWSRAAYELSGGWDEHVTVNDDGDITMRALARGARTTIVREGTAFYRRHDAPTLSGRRLTEGGLRSSMRVLGKLAAVLREENRLELYRAHLGAAFDQLAGDCREQAPLLASECERLATQYGGPGWRRRIRARERNLRVRTEDLRHLLTDPWGAVRWRREKRDLVEVRYGLDPELSVVDRRAARIRDQSEMAP